jgi:signal transduction histidine kinase
MSVLLVLLSGTLFIIYYSSYQEAYQKNSLILMRYTEAYWKFGNPEGKEMQIPKKDHLDDDEMIGERIYDVSSFYSVAFDDNGDVVSIDNDGETKVTDAYLIDLSRSLINQSKSSGSSDAWIYRIEKNKSITLVALMDSIVMSDNLSMLLKNMVLFGSIAIALLILPSILLAHNIVKPLEENFQKQRQFISDAGHELKTPIAVISANAEMLERDYGSNKWLDNIQIENLRMGELVKQLLQLARAESISPQMEQLDFSRLVTGSVLPFESIAFEKEQTLSLQILENMHVTGNAEQLGNLVSILIENALEYAPRQSDVQVMLKTEQHFAVLSVSNEGEMITEGEKKRLFDRFYRRDAARNDTGGHYGLGLSIAKAIILAHKGEITVCCEKQRITFTVYVPKISALP